MERNEMSWKLDWIDVQIWQYDNTLNDNVREAYLAAYSVLERSYLTKEKRIKESGTGEDFEDANEQLMYEEHRWNEQMEALAIMALSLLATSNKSFLDQLKGLFNIIRPPDKKGYQGKSQLHKQIAEYNARFGVDLEKINGFETIREVGLARDCCLHNESELTEEYRQQTKTRLVDKYEKITITPELLDAFLLEISEFSRELCAQMKDMREKAMPKAGG
jgi:hypothetical protein